MYTKDKRIPSEWVFRGMVRNHPILRFKLFQASNSPIKWYAALHIHGPMITLAHNTEAHLTLPPQSIPPIVPSPSHHYDLQNKNCSADHPEKGAPKIYNMTTIALNSHPQQENNFCISVRQEVELHMHPESLYSICYRTLCRNAKVSIYGVWAGIYYKNTNYRFQLIPI